MFLEPMSADGQTLKVQLETLRQFAQRIEGVITTLESSPAGPQHVGADRIGSGHLGKGFAEATVLTATYNRVHDQLETLSGQLRDQIEAMQITVDCIEKGYTNVDVEQRERIWQIYRNTSAYDKQHPVPAGTATTATPSATPAASQNTSGGQDVAFTG